MSDVRSESWPTWALEACESEGLKVPPFRLLVLGYEFVGALEWMSERRFEWTDGCLHIEHCWDDGTWCVVNFGDLFVDDLPDGWNADEELMACRANEPEQALRQYFLKRDALHLKFINFMENIFLERVGLPRAKATTTSEQT